MNSRHSNCMFFKFLKREKHDIQLSCWTFELIWPGSRSKNGLKLTGSVNFHTVLEISLSVGIFSKCFILWSPLLWIVSHKSFVLFSMLFIIVFEPPKMVAWWRSYGHGKLGKNHDFSKTLRNFSKFFLTSFTSKLKILIFMIQN